MGAAIFCIRLLMLDSLRASLPEKRLENKTLGRIGVDVVELLVVDVRENLVVDQEVNIVNFVNLVIFFSLFQSQSQVGTASAKAVDKDADRLARILLKELLALHRCLFGNLHGFIPLAG